MTADKPTFRANFSRTASANVVALVVPVLATPILSRLFRPADFASLAMFLAITSVIVSFATWRFDWVVPNEPDAVQAKNLFALGLCALAVSTVVVLAVLGVLQFALGSGTWPTQLGALLFLMPLLLFPSGLRELLSGWFVRRGDLTVVSHATVSRSLANIVISLAAGAARVGTTGLISAAILSAWVAIFTFTRRWRFRFHRAFSGVSRHALRVALRAHGRSATWSTGVSTLNALGANAPILALAFFFAPLQVGWYALIYRTATAPIGALTAALAQSFWSLAADYARREEYEAIARAYQRTTRRLAVAALVVVSLCLTGPLVVGPVLGPGWTGAGYVLAAVAPMLAGSVMFAPTNHLVVFGKQHLQLGADALRLILVIGAIASAHYFNFGFYAAVLLASIGSFAAHAMLYFLHVKVHRSYDRR